MGCPFDAEIHQSAVAPYALYYTVTSSDAAFDLTTVTAASFDVQHEAGHASTWTAVTDGTPTATSITIKHTFVAGDVDTLEQITVVPRLATPGGDILGEPKVLQVKSRFD